MSDIFTAIFMGDLEDVKDFIADGIDPTIENNLPVIYACYLNRLQIAKFLVSIGADPTAQNNDAIKESSIHGYFDIVRYLLSVGCDWKKCMQKHKEILKAEQILSIYRIKNLRKLCKNITILSFR